MLGEFDQIGPITLKELTMKKLIAAAIAAVFALGSLSALACPGDKAKDDKQISTPAKPKI